MTTKIRRDPCTDLLTDKEYLEHMIPHHQVAIDMSKELMKITTNPLMQHLCRKIIRLQSYEIWEMTMAKRNTFESPNDPMISDNSLVPTILDTYESQNSVSKKGQCTSLFFHPKKHMKHMEHSNITDEVYLRHMIPHHQVAVDMSKRLLLHTKNPYLIEFCKMLIIEQQGEILYMNQLLDKSKNFVIHSNLLN